MVSALRLHTSTREALARTRGPAALHQNESGDTSIFRLQWFKPARRV